MLTGKTRVTERKKPGDEGAEQGVFGDNSGYGIEYADFLPSGQVILVRPTVKGNKTRQGAQTTAIVVKTQGNLLGKKGYVFEPNKRFYGHQD